MVELCESVSIEQQQETSLSGPDFTLLVGHVSVVCAPLTGSSAPTPSRSTHSAPRRAARQYIWAGASSAEVGHASVVSAPLTGRSAPSPSHSTRRAPRRAACQHYLLNHFALTQLKWIILYIGIEWK